MDGEDTVRLAEEHQPDVAILDLALPVLNGPDAVRAIRLRCPETKPILLSLRRRQIAALLGISVKTVEAHRANIMRKLSIRDTAGFVRYAMRRGLLNA